jgi:hypothetical protein
MTLKSPSSTMMCCSSCCSKLLLPKSLPKFKFQQAMCKTHVEMYHNVGLCLCLVSLKALSTNTWRTQGETTIPMYKAINPEVMTWTYFSALFSQTLQHHGRWENHDIKKLCPTPHVHPRWPRSYDLDLFLPTYFENVEIDEAMIRRCLSVSFSGFYHNSWWSGHMRFVSKDAMYCVKRRENPNTNDPCLAFFVRMRVLCWMFWMWQRR